LQKHYSTFPGGRFGIGLLILRTTAGVATVFFGGILISRLGAFAAGQASYLCHLILGLLLLSSGIFLILGLMVPAVSIMMTGLELVAAYISLTVADPLQGKEFGSIALLLLASISIALFLLGPGAYSIDARIYGRKRIFIPSPKKEKGENT